MDTIAPRHERNRGFETPQDLIPAFDAQGTYDRPIMKVVVLSPAQQAEAVDHVLAIRTLGLTMADIFSAVHGKGADEAQRGAETMVKKLDRLLELLEAPPAP
jgi:hypothetical protein